MFDRIVPLLLVAAASLLCVSHAVFADEPAKKPASVLAFQLQDIDGKTVDLSKYKGEVLLIVNTASQCGYTPQYEGLEKIYEKYKARGFFLVNRKGEIIARFAPGGEPESPQVTKAIETALAESK